MLNGGIFHACVQGHVPIVLAGSIRDDGPLPNTEMDLIRARAAYAQALEGADKVLVLSSMVHSIDVGNMTPAGVKLVQVDINPSVVTKLSDRGSLESVGVGTDVGLFLSLLVQKLGRLAPTSCTEAGVLRHRVTVPVTIMDDIHSLPFSLQFDVALRQLFE